MTSFNPPEYVANILRHLTENGHAAYLVGGCVRDAVMGRPVHDWDIATSAAPVDVALLFPKTVLTGEKFGTVTVVMPECAVEVTTFRVEGEYQDGRRPKNVEFVSSIDDDLGRRDFTMNAMAVSVTGEFIDIFGGIEDIKKRRIRCVGGPNTRFSEDALRMFRAFRFSAELGFDIDKETLSAIYANVDRARQISAERIRIELEKTLMSQRPEVVGEMMRIGLLARFITTPGKNPEGLDKIEGLPVEPVMRWCAFCSILFANRLIASAQEFSHLMHLDGKTAKTCARALSIGGFPDDRIGIKCLFSDYGVDATRCAAAIHDILRRDGDLHVPENAEKTVAGFPTLAGADEVIKSGECFSLNKLAVTGSDLIALGYSPGQELGETLNRLLDHVIKRPGDNSRDILLKTV